MKKSPTLPAIKEKEGTGRPEGGLQSKETFRKLEGKVTLQEEEIVRNDKMISTLAKEFRLLKEQLEFEQEYSQKYRSTIGKY
jgi:hypothetical protein